MFLTTFVGGHVLVSIHIQHHSCVVHLMKVPPVDVFEHSDAHSQSTKTLINTCLACLGHRHVVI